MKNMTKKIKFSLPVRVVDSNKDLNDFAPLFMEQDDQIALSEPNIVRFNKGDYFILDFGEEKCGGIRLLTAVQDHAHPTMKIHVRFGESVSETCSTLGEKGACNDHSTRDFYADIPSWSDQMLGDTGFRFVRIDILEDNEVVHPFKSIYAWEYDHGYKAIKHYQSDDEELNQIFKTCKHTLELCMQNRIWDGIKRDRLVWIGDMEPEIHAALHLYGNIDVIKKTIQTAVIANPMPCWINNIPSYSAWFLLIMYDIYRLGGDIEFVKQYQSYVDRIIYLFDKSVGKDLDYDRAELNYGMKYFIDWPSYKDNNEEERIDANILLLQYVLPKVSEMYQDLKLYNTTLPELTARVLNLEVKVPETKVFAAFYQLLHHDEESYQVLIKDNSRGMSTFMSYYVLKAVAQKDKGQAILMLEEYYGGMLKLGATSFFEDFDISWLEESYRIDEVNKGEKKDLHRDHGAHCYVGFRHSLCHGWSVGPISFLIEEDIK